MVFNVPRITQDRLERCISASLRCCSRNKTLNFTIENKLIETTWLSSSIVLSFSVNDKLSNEEPSLVITFLHSKASKEGACACAVIVWRSLSAFVNLFNPSVTGRRLEISDQ